MLCSITGGWFSGKSSCCGNHLLYVMLFWSDHWHRYVLNSLVILYLSIVVFDLWFSIVCMGNLSGLFFMLGGRLVCWGCCSGGGCRGFSGILGVSSLLSDMYFVLSVRACGCVLHGFGQF